MATTGKFSFDKLDISNWATWKINMRSLLISKDLWAPVEPVGGAAVNRQLDAKALALITLCVADHHKSFLAECETSQQAWSALNAVYVAQSNAKRLQLLREMHNLKLLPGEALSVYFSRARDTRNQLLAAGHQVTEESVVWSVLAGLPSEYESMVNIIQAGSDALELEDILPKLMLVEQRQVQSSGVSFKAQAFAARTEFKGKCWKCGKHGHQQRDCRSPVKEAAARPGRFDRSARTTFGVTAM
jgi:hypothetical protein